MRRFERTRWFTSYVNDSDEVASPDAFDVTVDGIEFDVAYDPTQPGTYHYSRHTPPADDYGFTSRRSSHRRSTTAHHIEAIRDFLAGCDPVTGYMEDDPDSDGSDDVDGG